MAVALVWNRPQSAIAAASAPHRLICQLGGSISSLGEPKIRPHVNFRCPRVGEALHDREWLYKLSKLVAYAPTEVSSSWVQAPDLASWRG